MLSVPPNQSVQNAIKSAYPNLNYDISEDFLGTFDGLFSNEYCEKWIKHFEESDQNGLSYNRFQSHNNSTVVMEDQSIGYEHGAFYHNHDMKIQCTEFNQKFWDICYRLYAEKYAALKNAEMHKIYNVKVQRTKPGEGYHIWHFESSGRQYSNRILAFIVYLNTIEDGGETEFLYLKKRVKPVEGRLVIWPAGFTHTHRGNPPLADTKYIITGWVEL